MKLFNKIITIFFVIVALGFAIWNLVATITNDETGSNALTAYQFALSGLEVVCIMLQGYQYKSTICKNSNESNNNSNHRRLPPRLKRAGTTLSNVCIFFVYPYLFLYTFVFWNCDKELDISIVSNRGLQIGCKLLNYGVTGLFLYSSVYWINILDYRSGDNGDATQYGRLFRFCVYFTIVTYILLGIHTLIYETAEFIHEVNQNSLAVLSTCRNMTLAMEQWSAVHHNFLYRACYIIVIEAMPLQALNMFLVKSQETQSEVQKTIHNNTNENKKCKRITFFGAFTLLVVGSSVAHFVLLIISQVNLEKVEQADYLRLKYMYILKLCSCILYSLFTITCIYYICKDPSQRNNRAETEGSESRPLLNSSQTINPQTENQCEGRTKNQNVKLHHYVEYTFLSVTLSGVIALYFFQIFGYVSQKFYTNSRQKTEPDWKDEIENWSIASDCFKIMCNSCQFAGLLTFTHLNVTQLWPRYYTAKCFAISVIICNSLAYFSALVDFRFVKLLQQFEFSFYPTIIWVLVVVTLYPLGIQFYNFHGIICALSLTDSILTEQCRKPIDNVSNADRGVHMERVGGFDTLNETVN